MGMEFWSLGYELLVYVNDFNVWYVYWNSRRMEGVL